MTINYWAVLAATVAAWIFGAAFYGLLGERWMIALGRSKEAIEARRAHKAVPVVAMIVSFIAELVMALVLAGLMAHVGAYSVRTGLVTAALCWFGFVLTTTATNHGYQQARPALTLIDNAHWLGVLLLQGAILGALG